MSDKPRPRFQVVFEAMDDEPPPVLRLRKLLKTARRAYRMRAVEVKEWVQDGEGADGPDPGDRPA